MDAPPSTTARLRRTFAYPTDHPADDDDDDDNYPDAFDEQEQEQLIQSLAEENETRNAQFTTALLALPVISALPYLVVLLVRASSLSDRLIALLSLSSLASTAYMLRTLAPGVTGIWHLDAWTAGVYSSNTDNNKSKTSSAGPAAGFDPYARGHDQNNNNNNNEPYSAAGPSSATSTSLGPDYSAMGALGTAARRKRRRSSASSFAVWFPAQKTPLELYLPYLNVGLCVVLVLMSLAKGLSAGSGGGGGRGRGGGAGHHHNAPPSSSLSWGDFGLGNLPAIVYAVVLVAKVVMGSVDPEKELSALRYQYKGA